MLRVVASVCTQLYTYVVDISKNCNSLLLRVTHLWRSSSSLLSFQLKLQASQTENGLFILGATAQKWINLCFSQAFFPFKAVACPYPCPSDKLASKVTCPKPKTSCPRGCLENDDLENEDLRPRKRWPRKRRPRKRRPRKRWRRKRRPRKRWPRTRRPRKRWPKKRRHRKRRRRNRRQGWGSSKD